MKDTGNTADAVMAIERLLLDGNERRRQEVAIDTIDTAEVRRRKETAMNFPLTHVVARYMRDCGVDESDAELHSRELRRYLFVAATHPAERWPMVAAIDPLWHSFLLFTKSYQEFCRALGQPFIHHEPFDDESDRVGASDTYARFLDCYRAAFGEPPASVWPDEMVGRSDCEEFSCEQPCQGNCAGSD
jgi:hypothetical protein